MLPLKYFYRTYTQAMTIAKLSNTACIRSSIFMQIHYSCLLSALRTCLALIYYYSLLRASHGRWLCLKNHGIDSFFKYLFQLLVIFSYFFNDYWLFYCSSSFLLFFNYYLLIIEWFKCIKTVKNEFLLIIINDEVIHLIIIIHYLVIF